MLGFAALSLAAMSACATMLCGGIWAPSEPCSLDFQLDPRGFGGVLNAVNLSRSSYFHYKSQGTALVYCEFTALASVDAALQNTVLVINTEVDVAGCD